MGQQGLGAAADAHAAHRTGVEVIGADRNLNVRLADRRVVRDIEAAPALDHPGLDPGVHRHAIVVLFLGVHVPGDVARGPAEVAAWPAASMEISETGLSIVRTCSTLP